MSMNSAVSRASSVRCSGSVESMILVMRPGRGDMTTMRVDRNTASGIEWVTNITVRLLPCHSCSSCSLSRSRVISSSAPKGSSIIRSFGAKPSARAIDTRCCMPPDSCHGYLPSKPFSPTRSSCSRAVARACSLGTPCTSSGSVAFASTVRQGNSAGAWKT